MPVRIVQSTQNSRLKELRRTLANPSRSGKGLVGIEGPNLVAEALKAGVRLHCVFAAQGEEQAVKRLDIPAETEVLLLPREALIRALTTESPQPIAALIEPPGWTWAHLLGGNGKVPPLIVVLAELQDPGNLGTILRSAEAFGADGVVSLPGTVSAWNPKAVRASAGSVFRVPVIAGRTRDSMARLRESGVKTYAATARAARPVDLVDLAEPVALLIGNEGNGVPEELASQADGAITIPCPGPVESLNAAVAASVLLYEALRQRAERIGGPQNHRGGSR
jgi:RNA methyltransferase, TrmH family